MAALIKAFGPFHSVDRALPLALDIGVAVAAFALLCAAAALLRNLLVRRLQDVARCRHHPRIQTGQEAARLCPLAFLAQALPSRLGLTGS